MKRLIGAMTMALALTACSSAGHTVQETMLDAHFMRSLTALTQLDLFDRGAVERELHVPLQAYEQRTVPPSIAYRSANAAMTPFIEAKYETRNTYGWAALTVWLDDEHCYSSGMIHEEFDFLTSKLEWADAAMEKHGVVVVHSYPGFKNRLLIGYRKTGTGSYCAKSVEINAAR